MTIIDAFSDSDVDCIAIDGELSPIEHVLIAFFSIVSAGETISIIVSSIYALLSR
jgi:hypothetical protein